MAAKFLKQLPAVPMDSLPRGSDCPICLSEYSPTEGDYPVQLPCQHNVGLKCIRKWLSPKRSGANHCPLCRREFFAPLREDHMNGDDTDENYTDEDDMDIILDEHVDANDIDNLNLLRTTAESPEMRRLAQVMLGNLSFRESTYHLRSAQRTTYPRERALYLQLQREGARLPPLPDDIPGISVGDGPLSTIHHQNSGEHEEAFFQELQRMGAFNDPIGSRRRLTDDRRLANCMLFHVYRNLGLVFRPNDHVSNGIRGGSWSMR
ncbi:hypothetical protein BDR22DRAFT_958597 [Usnea florida]